jgi:amino acid adenylation domain-containing protein
MMGSSKLETFVLQNDIINPCLVTLHTLFERQAEKTPLNIAITVDGDSITYEQLNHKANQLARHLKKFHIKKETIIGVLLERGINSIISMLAILKIGAAFLIIDRDYPLERIKFILSNSKLQFLLIDYQTIDFSYRGLHEFPATLIEVDQHYTESTDNLNLRIKAKNLAYAIYTSGTTGNPKGVLIEHAGLVNTLLNQVEKLNLSHQDKVLAISPLSFDASIWEIGGALISGAEVILATQKQKTSIKILTKLMQESQATIATFTPSFLRLIPKTALTSLRCLISAGEACSRELLKKIHKKCAFYNAYGPTEASICATMGQCHSREKISLGNPLKNVSIHILKDDLSPATQGETGTLYIGGIGLARGYFYNGRLINKKFLKDSFIIINNETLYNSKDLVRISHDGSYEFIGREDNEIKSCGNRVNLSEIQSHLNQHPDVTNCMITVLYNTKNNKKRIIAVVETKNKLFNFKEMRTYLQNFLPQYMLPHKLICKKEIQLSHNGKLEVTWTQTSNQCTATWMDQTSSLG